MTRIPLPLEPVARAPQVADLTHCHRHPKRGAARWTDLRTPEWERFAVGVCADCAPPVTWREVTR